MSSIDEQTYWLQNLSLADNYTQWIYSQIEPYLGKNILEIGCGNGNITQHLLAKGRKVLGVDLEEKYVEESRIRFSGNPNFEVAKADINAYRPKELFDTIVLLDVLEHLEEDLKILGHLRKMLKPSGKLIIKVPALQKLYCEMDKAIGHYRRYRKHTLLELLNDAGFVKNRVWYFNFIGCFGWWLNGIQKKSKPPEQQLGLFDSLVPTLRRLENVVRPPIGLSIVSVSEVSSLSN